MNLEHLSLTGCPKVTHHGVWAIVSSSTNGILGLALEGVWHRFVSCSPIFLSSAFTSGFQDIAVFADLCVSSGALRRLRSVTLTIYFQMSLMDWVKDVVHLLSTSPLEIFQIYSAGLSLDSPISDELWSQLILTHGKRFLRISVHRILISWEAIHSICVQCAKLEQLFLVVDPSSLVRILTSNSFWTCWN